MVGVLKFVFLAYGNVDFSPRIAASLSSPLRVRISLFSGPHPCVPRVGLAVSAPSFWTTFPSPPLDLAFVLQLPASSGGGCGF